MDNLWFGLGITAVGMGLVFALLAVMWLLLVLAGRLDERAAANAPKEPEKQPDRVEVTGPGADELTTDELAAVTVAVIEHMEQTRREAAPAMRQIRPGSQIYASRWLATGRSRQTRPFTPRR